jgi:DMSO/TMAO reductase YedYZ molybdopterin-dependent catalytic subunit
LLEFPLESVTDDFECIEGWIAKDLSWRGIRVGPVLNRADPDDNAEYVLVHAMDGDYACSFPIDRVADALLAVELEDQPLPMKHGGPARLVPTTTDTDGYNFVKIFDPTGGRHCSRAYSRQYESDCWESVKWVTELEVCDSEPSVGDTVKNIATSRLD